MAVSDFERSVITPLVVSAAVMSSVSVYQMLVDITAFNETAFANMRRATGTMYDANVAGITRGAVDRRHASLGRARARMADLRGAAARGGERTPRCGAADRERR